MRHIIIGDVHGMLAELEALIEKVDLRPKDHVVFVGDLVDKGPHPEGVVRFVKALAERHTVVVVEGNHEEKHRRFRHSKNMAMKDSEEISRVYDALTDEEHAFMQSFVPFHRIPQLNVLVVHAGISGDMRSFPESVEEIYALPKKRRKAFERIMRTRYVDAVTGKMLALGANKPGDPFWAEVYDGRFGHVIFGHEPLDEVTLYPHATGIDTSAVFGGSLSAVVYQEGTTQPEVVSVKAERGYAQPLSFGDSIDA